MWLCLVSWEQMKRGNTREVLRWRYDDIMEHGSVTIWTSCGPLSVCSPQFADWWGHWGTLGTLRGGTRDRVFAANKHEAREIPPTSTGFISRYMLTLEPSWSIAIKIHNKLWMIGFTACSAYLVCAQATSYLLGEPLWRKYKHHRHSLPKSYMSKYVPNFPFLCKQQRA